MTSILIIEDEQPAYENLMRFINNIQGDYTIVGWLKSVEESVGWFLENSEPDLIFMDIQLSDGTAFDIFERIKFHTPVIFSTAFDEYAIQAFELNSVDYLLKPISFQSVEKALNKFYSYFQENAHLNRSYNNQKIKQIAQNIALGEEKFKRSFLVKRGNELITLPVEEIAYFYADEATFCVASNGRIYGLNESLIGITKKLDPKMFYKVNRKVICNSSSIVKVKRLLGSKLSVELVHKPDFRVVVSREKASNFKKWIESV